MQLRESLMEAKEKALDTQIEEILKCFRECGFSEHELLLAMSRRIDDTNREASLFLEKAATLIRQESDNENL